ncbi:MAG TPA: TetR family transcriptional regulator [Candidatus Cybelea sp.]|nr:TetR family transcriptional regulator [Candidatus Cybelea sp.]
MPERVIVLPAGPRRRAKGADRRRQVLEATLDVLAAKGFDLTIADIARHLGISTALILSHFKTKDQLLLETQRMLGREYHDNWQRALAASGPSAAEQLWNLVSAEFDEQVCTPRKVLAWKAFWAEARGRREYIDEFGPRNIEYLKIATALCAALIKEGRYQGYDARVAARTIDSLEAGLWLELTSTATPMTIHEARKTALEHLFMMFPRHFTTRGPIKRLTKRAK